MGRRVFLSILGIAFYGKCRYTKDDFVGTETTFVQQNLLEYLQQKEGWGKQDQVLMFLTDLAKVNNWNKDIRTRFSSRDQRDVPYIGLEKILLDIWICYFRQYTFLRARVRRRCGNFLR